MTFALRLPLATLAEATTMITLAIFSLVNAALWRIKRRDPAPQGIAVVPIAVPLVGFIISGAFLLLHVTRRLIE